MVRRLRLIDEPERRSPAQRVAALGNRIRDGLLRDNKVIPAVLAILTLLIFAWLIAGLFMARGPEEGQQQASKAAAPSQRPREATSNGGSETPTPGTDNRDAESFAAFGAPKDPFELPNGIASKTGGPTNGSTTGSTTSRGSGSGGSNSGSRAGSGGGGSSNSNGGSRAGSGGNSNGGSRADSGGSRAGSGGGGNGGASNGGGRGTGGGSAGGNTNAGGGGGNAGGSNAVGGSSGDLFNSGGDLPAP